MSDADAMRAFVKLLAREVAKEVIAAMGAPTTHYGSGRAATLPPGKSRAWAVRNLKHVPGARKVGRDWIVSVEDFEAWATERDAGRFGKRLGDSRHAANDALDEDALVAGSLAASGLRRAR